MEKLFGLWVDHEKAVIVSLIDGSHKVIQVESDIEGRSRLKGGSRSNTPYGIQSATSESKRDFRYRGCVTITSFAYN